MRLRTIPTSLSTSVVSQIDASLSEIQLHHSTSIPWAIESGSRAWGFPSPDSDYDCRFIYVRSREQYLSLWPKRDVIETPIQGDLDINGWDLCKALRLLLKGNAVVIEWLQSPIVYQGDEWLRDGLLALARRHTDRSLIARHYLHLGEKQRRQFLIEEKSVALKKIFYILRPAAALRWLRLHPSEAIAPMHFPTLMAECEPPPLVTELTSTILARKAETRELGKAALPKAIAEFIAGEFDRAREEMAGEVFRLSEAAKMDADSFFSAAIQRYGASAN